MLLNQTKRYAHVTACALLLFTLSGVSAVYAAEQESGQRGDWLSLRQIQNKVEAAGYEDVRTIKRKKWGYKVKAVTPEDHNVKLYVEPITGQVVYEKYKTKKR